MLRNLLYSLFLHFMILALMYLNVNSLYYHNLQTLFDKKGKPVKIELIDIGELEKKSTPRIKKEEKKAEITEEKKIEKPIIKEQEKTITEKKTEVKKVPKISSETISESIKSKPAETAEVIKNYEYIKKPDSKPVEEKKVIEEEKYDSTLDDIINETIQADDQEEAEEEETYADETEPTDFQVGEELKNVTNLSIREKVNIQRQIRSCYKMAILKSGLDSSTKVILGIQVKRDGNVNMKDVVIMNERTGYQTAEEQQQFEIAVENAKTALIFCSPLRNMPQNKYKVWKEMTLEFDSNTIEVREAE